MYSCNTTQQGTSGSIFAVRPDFYLTEVSCCSPIQPYYNTSDLEAALGLFLQAGAEAGSALTSQTTYQYDLVMLTLQVMSNYGLELHNVSWQAYNQSDRAEFATTSALFLDMLQDLDGLVGTQAQFLLGAWIQNATSLGNGLPMFPCCLSDVTPSYYD